MQELASARVWAVLASSGSIGVVDVSSSLRNKVAEVSGTSLTIGWADNTVFFLFTLDLYIPKNGSDETTDKVVEGVEVVEPVSPESGDLLVWNQDTTEGNEDRDEERVDESGKDGVGSVSGNELTDTSVEEFVEGHLEVYGSSDTRGEAEADDRVPASQRVKTIRKG